MNNTNRKTLQCLFLMFFGYFSIAQSNRVLDTAKHRILLEEAKTLHKAKKYAETISKVDSLDRILLKPNDKLTKVFGEALLYKSSSLMALRDYDQTLNLTELIMTQYESLLGQNSDVMALTLEVRGITFVRLRRYKDAIEILQKALKLRTQLTGDNTTRTILQYLNMAYAYKGDVEKAIFYSTKLLDILKKNMSEKGFAQIGPYGNLGIHYKNLGDYEKSIYFHNQNIELMEKYWGKTHPPLQNGYMNRGVTKKRLKLYDEAIADLEQSYQVGVANPTTVDSTLLSFARLNMGEVYRLKNDYAKSLEEFDKAIVLLQNFKEEEVAIAESYHGKALVYFELEDATRCIENINLAKKYNHYQSPEDFDKVVEIPLLIRIFQVSAQNYLHSFSKTGNRILLDSAYQEAQIGLAAINFLKKEMTFSEGRSRLTDASYEIFEAFLQILKATQQDTSERKAFSIIEQSKALQLYEAMKNSEVRAYSQIPPQYLVKERQFQEELVKVENRKRLLMAKKTSDMDTSFIEVRALQATWQLKNDSLKNEIAKLSSNYVNLNNSIDNVSLVDVQTNLLQPSQTLVQYFVGDSSIFAFVVKPNFYKLTEIKKDFPLDNWVKILRGSLSADNFQTQADVYTDMAFKLYEKLIKPIKTQLSEEVIIIPDGVLGYVPFEILLSQKPEKPIRFKEHAYLLREHSFSYCFSATLLREMMHKKHRQEPTKSLIAYAPFFDGDTTAFSKIVEEDLAARQDFTPLQNSGEEVFRISKMMKGEAFIGKKTTEQLFTETASTARILHLATHGKANDKMGDYSYLAFSPIKDSIENELLFVGDLYNLTLNADMVVLSACETGIGKLQRGEGIISLARAFAYAGAKSIITSLWAVNDTKTKDLMISFYKNLKKGKSKNTALKNAKMSMIDKNLHPYFWAGFIGIGNMTPLR
jgi:CHAT domain-containing protein